MAGRGKKKKTSNSYKECWNVGGYTRRSFDESGAEESNTITNQKEMLASFIKNEPNANLKKFYVDDGYSGTDFNRPGFKELLKDVVNGKINMIVVKDLSRLGRNYIEVGRYIEDILPMYNVRIVSINDNIDSWKNPESINSLIVPLKNLINDEYAKDISYKVKTAYQTMAKSGKFIAGTTPYGYTLDENDKHHLVIDEEEAIIVKKIFDMTLAGDGRIKITKYLNNNGILCRKEIQRRKKLNLSLEPYDVEIKYYWSTSTIGRMLANETYVGNLAQCKTSKVSYKNHNTITKKKDEWIRSENTHEAIIDKKTFKKVQKIINSNTYKRKKEPNLTSKYKNILKCGDCGKAMLKQEDTRGNRKTSNYYCISYLHLSKSCSKHKIRSEVLDNIVLETIKLQIKLVVQLDKALNKLNERNDFDRLIDEYNKKKDKLLKEIDKLLDEKKSAYEDYKFGNIDINEYKNITKHISDVINSKKSLINGYEESNVEILKKKNRDESWINHYKRNTKIKKVTVRVVKELIERIDVYENNKIKITFKYRDNYLDLLNFMKQEGVIDD